MLLFIAAGCAITYPLCKCNAHTDNDAVECRVEHLGLMADLPVAHIYEKEEADC